MKTVTVDWSEFMNGGNGKKRSKVGEATAIGITAYTTPSVVFAQPTNTDTWREIISTVIGIADWLCVGVIIFAGVRWMLGDRTKAIELLIGCSSGYLIVRHAKEMQEWLATL